MNNGYYIFALQRSGTNYMETMLAKNFVEMRKKNAAKKAWKHLILPPEKIELEKKIPIVIMHKNPYKWIESISHRSKVDWDNKQPRIYRGADIEYLDKKYIVGRHEFNLKHLCNAYRDWTHNWIFNTPNYIANRCIKLQYESLLHHNTRIEFLDRFRRQFDLERRESSWINPKPGTVSQSKDYDTSREEYYKSNGKLMTLQRHHINIINEILTPDLINRLGYNVL
jgi:hypothetical protein